MTVGRTHVSVRLDDEEIQRIDALAPHYSKPWHRATRSDLLRALILEALPLLEARQLEVTSSKPAKRSRKGGRR